MLGRQRPGLLHLPDGSAATVEDALFLCDEWGFGYDDWQRFTLAGTLREQPDGRWAAKEVGIEVARQNGKGELVEGRECLGLFLFGERKLIHSAHEFATASEALDRMDDRIGRNPALKQRVRSVKRSHGEEGVYLKDGRKLLYKTRTKGGGRGFGADLLVLDEAMFLPDVFLGALMPVISARPNPQMWYMGSAVDQHRMEHGLVFARLRKRALEARGGRLGYFGWSAAYDRDDDGRLRFESPTDVPFEATGDEELIAAGNPALGIRIELEHVLESERDAMDHRTFCVERLGVGDWPDPDGLVEGSVIPAEAWNACVDRQSRRDGAVCFAVDVTPDRSWAAVAAAGFRSDGLPHLEIMEHAPGTGWLADYVASRVRRHQPLGVFLAASSPAAALLPEFEERLLTVETLTEQDHARACGALFDAVSQGKLRHLGTPELTSAVRGAAKRPLGDSWAWSRKSSAVDISPLVAVTLALFGLTAGGGPSVYEDRGLTVIG